MTLISDERDYDVLGKVAEGLSLRKSGTVIAVIVVAILLSIFFMFPSDDRKEEVLEKARADLEKENTIDSRSVDEIVGSLNAGTEIIEHEILKSTRRGNGITLAVLVSKKTSKSEVMSLAKHLRSKHISKGFVSINIFDLRESYLRQGDSKYPIEELYKHFLVQVTVNPTTGHNDLSWVAEGRIP